MFAIYAVTFYVGAIFHRDEGLSVKDMFISIFVLMLAGLVAGIYPFS